MNYKDAVKGIGFIGMMTSANGNASALLALYEENPPVTSGFPSQRASDARFDVFLYAGLNKRFKNSELWF